MVLAFDIDLMMPDQQQHGSERIVMEQLANRALGQLAQQRGGPYPASATHSTSVGTAAIDRFLQPVTYQNVPDRLLPGPTRLDPNTVPRLVDGRLESPA